MNKDEYQKQKEEIIKQYGEPSSPYDEPNEAKLRLDSLRKQYRFQKQEEKKLEGPLIDDKAVLQGNTFPVECSDQDLIQFNDEERRIIKAWFTDVSQTNKSVAIKAGVTTPKVTAFLHSAKYIRFWSKACPNMLRPLAYVALVKLLREGNKDVTISLNKTFGVLEKDKQEITIQSKPIEDPELINLLKQLGDKAV